MSITLKVLDAEKEIAKHGISKGEVLTINAQENVNYQLIEDSTGFAPQNIIVKRDNNNLLVSFDDGDTETDLIIEDYYTDKGTSNQVIGLHENGQLYPYVPQSGESLEAISLLADQVASAQALGSVAVATPLWFFNPWWLAGFAGVVGGVALAAGHSGGSKSAVAEVADKPSVFSDKAGSTSVLPGDDNTEIKVTYTPNGQSTQETLTVKKIGNEWKAVDQNGQVIENDQLPQGITVDRATGQVNFEPQALAPQTSVSAVGGSAGKTAAEVSTPAVAEGLVAETPVIAVEEDGDKSILPGADNNELAIVYTPANSTSPSTLNVKKIGNTWQAVDKNGNAITDTTLLQGISIDPTSGQVSFKSNALASGSDLIATGKAEGKIDVRVKDLESVADTPATFVEQTGNTSVLPGDDNSEINVTYTPNGQTTPNNLTLKKIDNEWKVVDRSGNVIDETQLPAGISVDNASGKVSFAPEVLAPNTTVSAVGTAAGKKPAEVNSPVADSNSVADVPEIAFQPSGEKVVSPGEDNNEITVSYTPSNAVSPSTLTVKQIANEWKGVDKNGQALAQSALPQGVEINPKTGEVSFKPEALAAGTEVSATGKSAGKIDAQVVEKDSDNDGISDTAEASAKQAIENAIAEAEKAAKAYEKALADANENNTIGEKDVEALQKAAQAVVEAKQKAQTLIDNLPKTVGENDAADLQQLFQPQLDAVKTPIVPSVNDNDDDGISNADEQAAQQAVDKAIEEAKQAKQAYDTALAKAGEAVDAKEQEVLAKLANEVNNANAKAKALVDNLPATLGTSDSDKAITAEKQAEVAKLADVQAPANNDADSDNIADSKEATAQQAVEQAIENAKIAKQAYEAAKAQAGEAVDATEAAKLAELADKVNEANAKAKELASKLPETLGTTEGDKAYTAAQQAAADQLTDVTAPANNDADADGITDSKEAEVKQTLQEAIDAAKAAKAAYEAELAKAGEAIDSTEAVKLNELAKAVNNANAKAKTLAEQLPTTLGTTEGDQATTTAQQAEVAKLEDVTVPGNNDIDGDNIADNTETAAQQAVEQAIENAKIAKQAYEDALAKAGDAVDAKEQEALAKLANAVNNANAKAKTLAEQLPNLIGTTDADQAYTTAQQAEAAKLADVQAPSNNDADSDNISDADEQKAQQAVDKAIEEAKQAKQAYDTALAKAGDAVDAKEQEALAKLANEVNNANAKAKALVDNLPTTLGTSDSDKAITAEKQAEVAKLADVQAPSNNDADADGISNSKEAEAQNAVAQAIEEAKSAKQAYDTALSQAGNTITPEEAQQLTELAKAVNNANAKAKALVETLPTTLGSTEDDQAYTTAQQAEVAKLEDVQAPNNNDADSDEIADSKEAEAQQAVEQAIENAKIAKQAYEAELAKAGEAVDATEAAKLAELADKVNEANAKAKELASKLPETLGTTAGDQTYTDAQQAAANQLTDVKAPANNDADADGISDAKEAEAEKAVTEALQAAAQAKADYDKALTAAGEAIDADDIATLTELANKVNAANEKAKALIDALPQTRGATDTDNAYTDEQKAKAEQLEDVTVPANNDADSDGISDSKEAVAQQAVEQAIENAKIEKQAYDTALAQAGDAIDATEAAKLNELAKAVNNANAKAKALVENLPTTIGTTEGDQTVTAEKQAEVAKLEDVTAPANNDADADGISDSKETEAQQAVEQAIENAKIAKQAYEAELAKAGEAVDATEAAKLAELADKVNEANAKAKELASKLPETIGATATDNTYTDAQQAAANQLTDVKAPANNDADADGISDTREARAKQAVEEAIWDAKDAQRQYAEELAKVGSAIDEAEAEKLANLAKAVNEANAKAKALAEQLPETVGSTDVDKAYAQDQQTQAGNLQDVQAPSNNDADSDDISDQAEAAAKQAVEQAIENAKIAKQAYEAELAKAGEAVDATEAAKLAELAQAVNEANANAKALADNLPNTLGTTSGDQAYTATQKAEAEKLQDVTAPENNDADADGISDSKEAEAKAAVQQALADVAAAKQAYDTALTQAGNAYDAEDVKTLTDLADKVNAANAKAKALVEALPTTLGSTEGDQAYTTAQQAEVAKLEDVQAPNNNDADSDDISNADEDAAKQAVESAIEKAKLAKQNFDDALASLGEAYDANDVAELTELANKANTAKQEAETLANNLGNTIGNKTDADKQYATDKQTEVNSLPSATAPANNDEDADGITDNAETEAKKAVEKAFEDVAKAKEAYNTALTNAGDAVDATEAENLANLAAALNAANAKAKNLIEALPTTIGNQGDETTGDQAYIAEQNAKAAELVDVTAPGNSDKDGDNISDTAEANAKQAVDSAIEKAKLAKQNFDDALARLGEAYDANDVAELTELANKANTAKQEAETLANNLGNTIGNQTAEDQQYAQDKQAEASNLPTATAPANNDADADGITDNAETAAKQAVEEAIEAAKAAKTAYETAKTQAGEAVNAEEAENLRKLAEKVNSANETAKNLANNLANTIGDKTDEDKQYATDKQTEANGLEDVTAPSNSDADNDNISDEAETAAKKAVEDAIEAANTAKQAYDTALTQAGNAIDAEEAKKLAELAAAVNTAKQKAQELANNLGNTIGNKTDEDKQYATDKQAEANNLPTVQAPIKSDSDGDDITDQAEAEAKQAVEKALTDAATAKTAYDNAVRDAGEAITPEEADNLAKLAKAVNDANAKAKELANNLPQTVGNTESDQPYNTEKQNTANDLQDVTAPAANDTDSDGITNEAETEAKQAMEKALTDAATAKTAYDNAVRDAGEAITPEEADNLAKLAKAVNDANAKAKELANNLPQTVGNTESDQPYNTEKQNTANALQDVTAPTANDTDADGITDTAEQTAKTELENAITAANTAKQNYDTALANAGDVITPEEADNLAKLAKAVNDANATAKALANNLPQTVGNAESDQPYNTEKQTVANGLQDVTAPSSNDTDLDGITNEAETEAKQAMEKALTDATTAKTAYDNAVRDAGEVITPEEADNLAKLAKAVNDANAKAKELANNLPQTVGNTESDQPYNTEKQNTANALQDVTAPTANDTDADGITDKAEADAKQAVEKALKDAATAKQNYDTALANAGDVITPEEAENLARLAKSVNDANATAKALAKNLPQTVGNTESDQPYNTEKQNTANALQDVPQIQEPDAITITNITSGTKDEVGGVTIRLDNNGANTDKVVVRFQDEQGTNQVVTYTKSGNSWTADKAISGMTMDNGTITLKPNTVAGAKEIGKTATAVGTDGMAVQAESLRNNNLNGTNVAKQKVATSAGVASTDKSPEALVMGLDSKGNVEVAGIADKVKLVVDYNGTPVTLTRADTNTDWSGLPSGVTISADKTKLLIADSAIPTDRSVIVRADGNNDVNPEIVTTYDPNVPQVTFAHGSSASRTDAGQVTVTADAAHTRMVIKYYDETGVLYGGAKPMAGDPTLKEVVAVKTGNTWRFESAPQLYTGDKDMDPGTNDIIISGNSVVFKPNAILDSSKIMVTAYTAAGKSVVQLDRAKEDFYEGDTANWTLYNETPVAVPNQNRPTQFRKTDVGDVMFQGSRASEQMYIEYFNNAGELVTTKFVRPEGTTYSIRNGVQLANVPSGSKFWVMEDGSEVAAPFIILMGTGRDTGSNNISSNVIKLDGSQVLDNSVVTLYSYSGLGKANVSSITSLGATERSASDTPTNSLKSVLEKGSAISFLGYTVDFGKATASTSETEGVTTPSKSSNAVASETGINHSLSEDAPRYADNGTAQPLFIEQPQITLI